MKRYYSRNRLIYTIVTAGMLLNTFGGLTGCSGPAPTVAQMHEMAHSSQVAPTAVPADTDRYEQVINDCLSGFGDFLESIVVPDTSLAEQIPAATAAPTGIATEMAETPEPGRMGNDTLTLDGRTYERYQVAWVVDGDTIAVYTDSQQSETRYVRFVGIDTPESVASEEYEQRKGETNSDYGKESSQFTQGLIEAAGNVVYLAKDVSDEDQYGRWLRLAYIITDGEPVFLNSEIVRNGYARVCTIQPDSTYADRFAGDQEYARAHNLGHWKDYYKTFE